MAVPIDISLVIPIFNEVESVGILQAEIAQSLDSINVEWEVIYVDDCSSDGSLEKLLALRQECSRIRILKFRRNYGQTAAMAAGFDASKGAVVVTLDGDLQNDPADIPMMVKVLHEGDFDLVAGWRKDRQDGFVLRRLPSIMANRLIGYVGGVTIHDTGCTLKVFRRELAKTMTIYAEQHRFLPFMSAGSGARVCEVVVNHRARRFGSSKYGIGRATRVLMDLFTVKLISQFSQRPLQYFGMLSLGALAMTVLFAFFGLVKIGTETGPVGEFLIIDDWELVIVSGVMLMFTLVVYYGLLGLLAELTVKASGMHRRGVLDRILNELH
ncbi:MAG: glycosyltransferase involved in cell wall biosynthesis [Planctomycetota bacterium]|jgi:glycosyltransferase involved in cell wall biosynthesis